MNKKGFLLYIVILLVIISYIYITIEDNKYNMSNEQKIDIINQSIAGLIKLINSCEASEQIAIFKNICSKTSSSIQNTKDNFITIRINILYI